MMHSDQKDFLPEAYSVKEAAGETQVEIIKCEMAEFQLSASVSGSLNCWFLNF